MNKVFYLLWAGALWASYKLRLAEIFFICSGLFFIFWNLGKREGESAYSVFNEGCKSLAGEFNPGAVYGKEEKRDTVSAKFFVKNRRLANKPCPCGSGKKHKKCCYVKKEEDSD